MKKTQIKAVIGIILVILLFVLATSLIQNNLIGIEEKLSDGVLGMLIYIFILIIATVVAPVSAVPIMPIASNMWGWFFAGILSVIGWTSGGVIAFLLARKYGVPLVNKFVSLDKIEKFEKMIPLKNIFWSIVLLRLAVPVDVLSYILGLFSRIKFKVFFWATLVGVMPFSFLLAFLGILPFTWQILFLLLAGLIILLGFLVRKGYKKKKKVK